MTIQVIQINPHQAKPLIDELDDLQSALYPPESNHLDGLEVLGSPAVTMVGVVENHQIIAIGAVKNCEAYGEIKRVYVPEKHRKKGLAKMIMAALEQCLTNQSIRVAKLETGILQKEAIGLYTRLGYRACPPFGSYHEDPLSVFMSKHLGDP